MVSDVFPEERGLGMANSCTHKVDSLERDVPVFVTRGVLQSARWPVIFSFPLSLAITIAQSLLEHTWADITGASLRFIQAKIPGVIQAHAVRDALSR